MRYDDSPVRRTCSTSPFVGALRAADWLMGTVVRLHSFSSIRMIVSCRL